MGLHGSTWVCMGLPGSTWVYLGLPGSTWVYFGLLGSTWVYLGLRDSSWLYMNDIEHSSLQVGWVGLDGSPGGPRYRAPTVLINLLVVLVILD